MQPRRWSVMIVLVLQGALAQCTIRDVTESETCCGQGLAGAGDGGDADGSRETGGTRWGSGGSTGRDDATGGLATAETTGGAAHGISSGGSGTEGSRPIYVPAAARLDCGEVRGGSIEAAGEEDLLGFEGDRASWVGLTLVQTSGLAGHARAQVFDPSGAVFDTLDSNGVVELALSDNGTYAVRGAATNGTDKGDYRFGLQCLVPAEPVEHEVGCGAVVSDSIDEPAEADLLTFEGASSSLVGLTLVQTSGFAGHAQARVFNPSGSILHTFDANSLAELSLPETGTYVVRVVAKNLVDTGNYRLGLHCLRSVDPVEHELECGTVASDSIKAPAEADLMTFEGKSGTLVGLTLVQTSGFAGRAQARVFNPSGSILHTFDANALAELSLPESGTYVVRVVAKNLVDTGNYRLGLQCLTPADPVDNALDCGAVVSDSIDAPAEADLLTFEGKTGSLVGLTLVQTSGFAGHAQARVFNPSGSILHTFDASALAQLSLPESGTYVVRILAKNLLDSGDYRFGAQCIVPATTALDPPNPDGCGGRVTGTLDAPAEAHLQRFEGDAGDWVGLTVVKTTGFAGQARATVFTPSGTTLQTLDTNSQAQFVLPESGEHLVRIMAKNLADAGSYAVSWHCLVPPSPVVAVLVCGSGASGSLEAPAEADLFTFSGQAGAKVQVTLTRTAGFSGLARAQVFAPSGAVVHTFDSDGAPEIALSETGVHVIRVQARNLVDSGGYDLGFVCDSGT